MGWLYASDQIGRLDDSTRCQELLYQVTEHPLHSSPIQKRGDVATTPVPLIDAQDATRMLLSTLQTVDAKIEPADALRCPSLIASIADQPL